MERTKNAIRNTKWGVIHRLATMLGSFCMRTVLIYKLGAEYAGLNSLFTSVLSILSLTELGFSNAIVYSMYKPIAEKDNDTLCALLNLYKKTYRVIGGVILGLGLMLLPVLKFLIKSDVPPDINLYVLYIAFLSDTVISYFLFAYKSSLLYAHQRNDIGSRNSAIIDVSFTIGNILLLLVFGNYYIYVVCLVAATISKNLYNSAVVDRLYPEIRCRGQISKELKDDIKQRVLGLVIWKVGAATRNTLDSIVISAFLGLITVTIYNNYFYIMTSLSSVFGIITSSFNAGVGNKLVTDTPEENYKDFNKFNLIYVLLTGWASICLLCLYQPFMTLWMGEDLLLPFLPMVLFCVYFFVMKMGDINSTYYHAAGLWHYGRYRSIIEAGLNLCFNLVFGYLWGVTGVILATILSMLIIWPYASGIVFKQYFKHCKAAEFQKQTALYALMTAMTGALTYGVCLALPIVFGELSTIAELFLRGIVCVLAFFVLWACFSQVRWYPEAKEFVLLNAKRVLAGIKK